MAKDWFGIDQHRLDKFLMVRTYYKQRKQIVEKEMLMFYVILVGASCHERFILQSQETRLVQRCYLCTRNVSFWRRRLVCSTDAV